MGSATTQGRPTARDSAAGRVAFRSGDSVGALIANFRSSIPSPSFPLFTLHWTLRSAQHKTRGRADRYSFLVRLFHPQLHAGSSRRTTTFFSRHGLRSWWSSRIRKRLPSYPRHQSAFDGLLGHQPHRPSGATLRRIAANHGDDALPLAVLQHGSCARPWFIVECLFQAGLLIATSDLPHCLGGNRMTLATSETDLPSCKCSSANARSTVRTG